MVITANQNLTSFSGLSSFKSIDGSVLVSNNPSLMQSVVQAFVSSIAISGTVTIN